MSNGSRRGGGLMIPDRPPEGRLVGGVCVGLAEGFHLDATLVRLAFLLLVFVWGLGLVLYGVLWLLMPERGDRVDSMGEAARRNVAGLREELGASAHRLSDAWQRTDRASWPRPLGRRWIAIGLIAVGAIAMLASVGALQWLTPLRALALAAISIGAAVLVGLRTGG